MIRNADASVLPFVMVPGLLLLSGCYFLYGVARVLFVFDVFFQVCDRSVSVG